MTRRILWLAFWTTPMFWLGSLWGCAGTSSETLSHQVGDWVELRQAAAWSAPPLQPPQPPAPAAKPAEAKNILERWSWPAVVFRPAADQTANLPVYFADCPIGWSPRSDSQADRPQPAQLLQESEQASHWNLSNALGALVQPVKFGADMVLFPVKLVLLQPGGPAQPAASHSQDALSGGNSP